MQSKIFIGLLLVFGAVALVVWLRRPDVLAAPGVTRIEFQGAETPATAKVKGCEMLLPESGNRISYRAVFSVRVSRELLVLSLSPKEADSYLLKLFNPYDPVRKVTTFEFRRDISDPEQVKWLGQIPGMPQGQIDGEQLMWSGSQGDSLLSVFISRDKDFIFLIRKQ